MIATPALLKFAIVASATWTSPASTRQGPTGTAHPEQSATSGGGPDSRAGLQVRVHGPDDRADQGDKIEEKHFESKGYESKVWARR